MSMSSAVLPQDQLVLGSLGDFDFDLDSEWPGFDLANPDFLKDFDLTSFDPNAPDAFESRRDGDWDWQHDDLCSPRLPDSTTFSFNDNLEHTATFNGTQSPTTPPDADRSRDEIEVPRETFIEDCIQQRVAFSAEDESDVSHSRGYGVAPATAEAVSSTTSPISDESKNAPTRNAIHPWPVKEAQEDTPQEQVHDRSDTEERLHTTALPKRLRLSITKRKRLDSDSTSTLSDGKQPKKHGRGSKHFPDVIDDRSSLRSWKTDDATLNWSTRLCKWIKSLSSNTNSPTETCIFMTPRLSLVERSKAHFIAQSHGLFHVSVGHSNSAKRVFISPFKMNRQRLTSKTWKGPHVDLNVLCIQCQYWRERSPSLGFQNSDILRGIQRSDFPNPIRFEGVFLQDGSLTHSRDDPWGQGRWKFRKRYHLCVEYENSEDAAFVKARLEQAWPFQTQTRPGTIGLGVLKAQYAVEHGDWTKTFVGVDCAFPAAKAYLRFLNGTEAEASTDREVELNENKYVDQFLEDGLNEMFEDDDNEDVDDVGADRAQVVDGETWLEVQPAADRSPFDSQSRCSSISRHTNVSRASLASQMSRLSCASTRSRLEKVKDGYECGGCHKVFDRQCDRNKHFKNTHGERPHICSYCEKGFVSTKDLSRHMRSLHGASLDIL